MYKNNEIWMALAGNKKISVLPRMANRHGLIAGATGTGKTITLKVMAESFSDCGVPVFLADVKGDLAGMCEPGTETGDMKRRMEQFGLLAFPSVPIRSASGIFSESQESPCGPQSAKWGPHCLPD